MSKYCQSCGKSISEDAAFCPNCGAPTSLPSPSPSSSSSSQDQNNIAVLVWIGTIFFSFIPGLIVYLTNNDAYVKAQAREALNWSITTIFGYIIGLILTVVFVGLLVIIALVIMNFVFCIMGAVACSNKKDFRAPMTIRLIN